MLRAAVLALLLTLDVVGALQVKGAEQVNQQVEEELKSLSPEAASIPIPDESIIPDMPADQEIPTGTESSLTSSLLETASESSQEKKTEAESDVPEELNQLRSVGSEVPEEDVISEDTVLPNPSGSLAVENWQESLLEEEQEEEAKQDEEAKMSPQEAAAINAQIDAVNDVRAHLKEKIDKIDYRNKLFGPTPIYSKVAITPGTLKALASGALVAFESEVEPGMFITHKARGDLGTPGKWHDMKHYFNGEFGLAKGITPASTFSMSNEGKSGIKSGDLVKWLWSDKQLIVNMGSKTQNGGADPFAWPHPFLTKEVNEAQPPDFKIELAREIDMHKTFDKPMTMGGWGFNSYLKIDPRLGEDIKDGDSVWIRIPATKGDPDGDWFWASCDPGEKYTCGFPHHYPGYDGHTKHVHMNDWMNVNDGHASSARFTVRIIGAGL